MEEIWDILHVPTGTFFSDGYVARGQTAILNQYDVLHEDDAKNVLNDMCNIANISVNIFSIEYAEHICNNWCIDKDIIFAIWAFMEACYCDDTGLDSAQDLVTCIVNKFNIYEYEICKHKCNYIVKFRRTDDEDI